MKQYYNRRIGKEGEQPKLTLAEVAQGVAAGYGSIESKGFLQRDFGYFCVDAGEVPGNVGADLRIHFYLATTIRIEKSIAEFFTTTDEAGLLTLIEFLHDHVAKPEDGTGRYHSFSGCGWHYTSGRFDAEAARGEWRSLVNTFIKFYGDGFELSANGEVVRLAPDGLAPLFDTAVPAAAGEANIAKVETAVRMFRRGLSSREEQKQAIRALVDLLEFYRPQVKEHLLSKDENALFEIANKYAIRHHRADQKDDYDDVWLRWLFYFYLSTVHLVLGLVHHQQQEPATSVIDDDDVPF
jgi:hypothetical protein